MNKVFFILVLFLVASNGIGQIDTVYITHDNDNLDTLQYVTDTVLFDSPTVRHIITGTSVLNSSKKNELSKNYGYNLINIEHAPCNKRGEYHKGQKDEVINVQKTDSLWSVVVNVNENCCYSFLGEIEVVNDTILNLVYHGYGSYCFCNCCFGLTYTIERWKYVNEYDIKYFMINEDEDTLVKME